jgi:predicted DNA-binding WGR domain protein
VLFWPLTTDHRQLTTGQKSSSAGTTVHKHFECADPERNHKKFYKLAVGMLLFGPTVTRRWSRIGSRRPRTLSKDYETWEEAKREIRGILRRRERRGYRAIEGWRFKAQGLPYV